MKTLILTAAISSCLGQDFSFGSEHSDGNSDAKQMSGGPLRRVTQIQSMTHTILCGGDTANCDIRAGHVTIALRNYGCNCFPENYDLPHQINPATGRKEYIMGANGMGLDDLDTACGDLHRAYNCIVMDHDNGVLPDPRADSDFPSQNCGKRTAYQYHWDGSAVVCGPSNNPNYGNNDRKACNQAVCQIELEFAYKAAGIFGDLGPRDFRRAANRAGMYNLGANGDAACIKAPAKPDECCGQYPVRYPFVSDRMQCCSGNSAPAMVRETGSC